VATRSWARDFSVTTFTAEEGRVVTETQLSPLPKRDAQLVLDLLNPLMMRIPDEDHS
jgi:hypothetical protein